jgi:hypothetical protein
VGSIEGVLGFLSYFSTLQLGPTPSVGHICIRISIAGVGWTGQQVTFQYSAEEANLLTKSAAVVLVYGHDRPITTAAYASYGYYSSLLGSIVSALPAGAVSTGFNRKCLFGFGRLPHPFLLDGHIEYNLDSLPGSPVYSMTIDDGSYQIFCMVEYYNCTPIDPHCIACLSHSICSQCTPQYYNFTYPNITSVCLLCANAL